jgi:hypothetical protein
MVFIYDSAQANELRTEKTMARAVRGMVMLGVSEEHGNFLGGVRVMLNHRVVVVPTSLDHCTAVVERLRIVALQCNIRVVALAAYLNEISSTITRPAVASAAPPTQQAAVGQTS